MSDVAIRVENLSKRYRIGGPQARYKTIRESMTDLAVAPLRRLRRLGQPTPREETIWALKDVSFEVKHGEVLGIIGPNGAGKTTLLKVLSRITEPTEGEAEIHGRVGSLLEVGTGFHPELTGRENIYLSGAILGMKRSEIDKKFDEIVQFAEIEKFLDTPAKRYSSGMQVRLAFAVAAHLEPEILLVDEVLAVGDTAFQKKCLGRMGDVAKGGRTVLFVSHNMGAIAELCSKVVLIRSGRISMIGSPADTVTTYLAEDSPSKAVNLLETSTVRPGEKRYRIAFVELRNDDGELCSTFSLGDTIVVRAGVVASKGATINLGIGVRDSLGRQVLHFSNNDDKETLVLREDLGCFELHFANILNAGEHHLTVWLGDGFLVGQDYALNCLRFSVDTSSLGKSLGRGLVIQPGDWHSVGNP